MSYKYFSLSTNRYLLVRHLRLKRYIQYRWWITSQFTSCKEFVSSILDRAIYFVLVSVAESVNIYVCRAMYRHHLKQSMDQPGKIANPARDQLNRDIYYPR